MYVMQWEYINITLVCIDFLCGYATSLIIYYVSNYPTAWILIKQTLFYKNKNSIYQHQEKTKMIARSRDENEKKRTAGDNGND